MESPQILNNLSPKHSSFAKGFSDNLVKVFSVSGLSIGYGKEVVLQNINFDLHLNELVFITGKTGSGKSTFLNFIYSSHGIEVYSGQVQRFHSNNDNLFASRIFQDLKVFGDMTVFQNLELAYDTSIYQNRHEFLESVESYCKILDIYDHLNKKLDNLNGATSQKLAIIRSILCKPRVVLADEPTSSLDLSSTHRVYDLFNLLNHKTKMSVVWVTHDRSLVKKFSGRIFHIDGKKLMDMRSDCFI